MGLGWGGQAIGGKRQQTKVRNRVSDRGRLTTHGAEALGADGTTVAGNSFKSNGRREQNGL